MVAGPDAAAGSGAVASRRWQTAETVASRRWQTMGAGAVYLIGAVLVWWHAWAGGAQHSLAAGSVDPAQEVWFLGWVPHALGHGLNPLYSRAMFFPHGVNLLANTSFLLVGLLLAPVTVLFGPVAAFTVAVTLAPAADALVAFVVLRRFTSWAPAAFAGGLLYGFGPFVATDLRYGHLHMTVALCAPLALLLVDRMVHGAGRAPWRLGLALAALVIGEFFVSAEILTVVVVVGTLGLAASLLSARGRRAGTGVGGVVAVGALVSGVVLAFPLWWYVAGPRHFSGSVWKDMRAFSATLASFVVPHGELTGTAFLTGGNGDYLGVPLLVVLAAGLVVWRRDRLLRLVIAMAALCALMSLGPTLHAGRSDTGMPLPAWPLQHLPLVSSLATSRFAVCTDLLCALALVLVLDHVHGALERVGRPRSALLVPGAVTVAALLPPALAAGWPYATEHLAQPTVMATVAELPPRSVVREYPLPTAPDGRGLVWQATAGFSYSLTDGYAIVPDRRGRATVDPVTGPLGEVFVGVSLGRQVAPFSAALVEGVRRNAWGEGATAVAVVRGARHGSVVAQLLEAALGPPSYADASGELWLRDATSLARCCASGRDPIVKTSPAANRNGGGPPHRRTERSTRRP